MTGWVRRWRVALRVARRDALRHRGRSLLVVAMVGLPLLAVVGADTLYRTNDVSATEALPARLGAADVRITGESRQPVVADPATGEIWQKADQADPAWTREEVAAALPAGSRVVAVRSGALAYRTADGLARVTASADDFRDPLRAGAVQLVAGRLPTAPDEVAVSPGVAARGVGVGARLQLGSDGVAVRVVAVVASLVDQGRVLYLTPAAAGLLQEPTSTFYATVPGGLDWPAVQDLARRGLDAVSRRVALAPPPRSAWAPRGEEVAQGRDPATTAVLALIVVSVLLEVVLLAGPAFAVGIRRQRRDLALTAAAGGAPADLRRVVLAGGLVLGGVAAVVGALAGVGLARLAVPQLARRGSTFGPFEVSWRDLALVVAVGIAAGLAAAWFPARQAARTDVVDTLAGRRGQVRTSWRSPVLGLLLAAAGTALVVLGARGGELGIAGGAVVLVSGVVVASPWLVGLLAPLGSRLPVAGRLALRDATRNRGRTAPAVAAVMATVSGVTALAIGSASDSAQSRRDYVPQAREGTALVTGLQDGPTWDAVAGLAAAQAPGRAVHRILGPRYTSEDQVTLALLRAGCTGGAGECAWSAAESGPRSSTGDQLVGDPGAVEALFPAGTGQRVAAALQRGTAVVLADGLLQDGTIAVGGVRLTGNRPADLPVVRLPAVRLTVPAGTVVPSLVVLPASAADRLAVPLVTSELVVGGPDDPVTAAQEEQLRQRVAALSPNAGVSVERGWTDRLATARLLLVLVGAALVLVATLTATGLALTDARPDLATLAAVGAAPRTRRLMAMGSAAVVGGTGAALGLLVGLAPGIAVAYPLTSTDYGAGAGNPLVVIPWTALGAVVVLVPLLAVAVSGAVVRSRLPMATRLG